MLPSSFRVQVMRRVSSSKLIACTSPVININTCRLISSLHHPHFHGTLDKKSSKECCSPSSSKIVAPAHHPFYGESILLQHSHGREGEFQSNLKIFKRDISVYRPLFNEQTKEGDEDATNASGADEEDEGKGKTENKTTTKKGAPVARHMNRDRSKIIPVETSMRYLKSEAYRETYGENPIWVLYRRNFPGQFAPKKTRRTCIRGDTITTGNPCPICRDVYLVVDYQNVDLLKQFISPYTGNVLGWDQTGICRRQHERLVIEIDRARDYGTITFDVPFREYDYKEYENIYAKY